MTSHFSLDASRQYQDWKTTKLSSYPTEIEKLITPIAESYSPTKKEISSLLASSSNYNFALYRFTDGNYRDKQVVHTLGQLLGLNRLDGNICADDDKLTSIEARNNPGQHEYIPYTRKKLSWHTDGYYNTPEQQIHGMLLHCAQPALSGGVSLLMDHAIAYILLRDENPAYIKALMQVDAMTIPANILDGEIIRPQQTGPVFSISKSGHLHMRYSARKRNIKWKDDDMTREAVQFLDQLWEQGSPYIIEYKMNAGEGLICNNILHCRTNFEDSENEDEKRLLYRGRYYDRLMPDI